MTGGVPFDAAVRHGLTLAWRSLVPLKNSPGAILGWVMQPVIMILVFVYLFGGAAAGGDRHGAVMYAVPGVLVQSALMATITTGISLNTDLGNGVFDRFRSLPIARSAPLVGRILADLVGLIASVTAALLVGLVVGFRITTGPLELLTAVGLVLVCATGLSWVSAFIGMISKSVTAMQMMAMAVMLPLTMGSSAFISADNMPGWVRAWMTVNPVSHLANATRGLMESAPFDAGLGYHTGMALGCTALLTAVFAPLAIRAYRRRI